jgi:hypothetical protein
MLVEARAIGVPEPRVRGRLAVLAVAVAAFAGGILAPTQALDRVVLTMGTVTDRRNREYEVWDVRLKDGQ